MGSLKEFFANKDDLKDKVYYITLGFVCIAMFVFLILDYIQGFSDKVLLTLGFSFVVTVALFFLSIKFHIENIGKNILVYLFNVVVFPELFLESGGITCGMILIFVLSLLILGVLLEGKMRMVAYFVSLAAMEATLYYTYVDPDYVKKLSFEESVLDYGITLFIISLTIVYIIGAILREYDKERQKTSELNKKLRELSVRDELSGLYNRRELFRRLDTIYGSQMGSKVPSSKENCYIAMFDIDNFKSLNDNYGHQFGDEVLATIAQVLMNNVSESEGELAARYGGEEFVSVIRAKDQNAALDRVEKMRREIENITWLSNPKLVVTVSGGLANCEMYDNLNSAIHEADELLYRAKRQGKNQIIGFEE